MSRPSFPRCATRCCGYCTHRRTAAIVLAAFVARTAWQMRELRMQRSETV